MIVENNGITEALNIYAKMAFKTIKVWLYQIIPYSLGIKYNKVIPKIVILGNTSGMPK